MERQTPPYRIHKLLSVQAWTSTQAHPMIDPPWDQTQAPTTLLKSIRCQTILPPPLSVGSSQQADREAQPQQALNVPNGRLSRRLSPRRPPRPCIATRHDGIDSFSREGCSTTRAACQGLSSLALLAHPYEALNSLSFADRAGPPPTLYPVPSSIIPFSSTPPARRLTLHAHPPHRSSRTLDDVSKGQATRLVRPRNTRQQPNHVGWGGAASEIFLPLGFTARGPLVLSGRWRTNRSPCKVMPQFRE